MSESSAADTTREVENKSKLWNSSWYKVDWFNTLASSGIVVCICMLVMMLYGGHLEVIMEGYARQAAGSAALSIAGDEYTGVDWCHSIDYISSEFKCTLVNKSGKLEEFLVVLPQ